MNFKQTRRIDLLSNINDDLLPLTEYLFSLEDEIEKIIEMMKNLKGKDGHTPVRGKDYWTKEEIATLYTSLKKATLMEEQKIINNVVAKFKKSLDDNGGVAALIDYGKVVKMAVEMIPKPKDGKSVSLEKVISGVLKKIKIPQPKPGAPGKPGEDGDDGKPPQHQWKGTKLRFKNPDGTWGEWVDLRGKDTPQVRAMFRGGGLQADGTHKITVGSTAPTSPQLNDLWVDTSI